MRSLLIFTLVISFFYQPCFAQDEETEKEPVQAFLDQGDIDRYNETMVPMYKEFKELGLEMEGKEGNPAAEWQANADGRAILTKYGWNEEFGLKFGAITWGYTYLKMKIEIDKLPDEQRAQVQAMMPMFNTYELLVHPDDLAMIKPNMDTLDKTFKKLEKL